MSLNTIEENRSRRQLDSDASHWVFGYGSLIFKVDFPYLEKRHASIQGWERRFWQGSHDHRGTEENPGRVVTLIESADSRCGGIAYRVDASVFDQLDVREKNGYLCFTTPLLFESGERATGHVYIATSDNEAWLGEASEKAIAQQIANAVGPSGPNTEYLLKMADALRSLGEIDEHIFAIEQHLTSDV
ncbi:MAG: gamma-glutamylcyclotransferase [Pseudomonadota bacterium]